MLARRTWGCVLGLVWAGCAGKMTGPDPSPGAEVGLDAGVVATRDAAARADVVVPPPSGDGLEWVVDGAPRPIGAFVPAAGPSEGDARNFVSRVELPSGLSLSVFERRKADYPISWIELAVMHDPLRATRQDPVTKELPPLVAPELAFSVGVGKLYPLHPHLASWVTTNEGRSVRLTFPADEHRLFADGAGHVWPMIYVRGGGETPPTFEDLAPLFPPNPGSMWVERVRDGVPARTDGELAALREGNAPFDRSRDPWSVQGVDEKYTPQTGYHGDWPWAHLAAYHARGELADLEYVMPSVYRQAARPCHFHGLRVEWSTTVPQALWFFMGRPAKWGTDFLGRAPAEGAYLAPGFYGGSVYGEHDWTGPDHQHASLRRVAEFAEATGSPWAYAETLYYGELAKASMRVTYQFEDTPRGHLGWVEIALRAHRLDPSDDSAVRAALELIDAFIAKASDPARFPWATQILRPLWAIQDDRWLGRDTFAAASFEDLRAIPSFLAVANHFGRADIIDFLLRVAGFYVTEGLGWTEGGEGVGRGIKVIVAPGDPSRFRAPGSPAESSADLAGYNVVSGLGLELLARELDARPRAGYDAARMHAIAAEIRDAASPANARWFPY